MGRKRRGRVWRKQSGSAGCSKESNGDGNQQVGSDPACILSYRCPSKDNGQPWKEIRVKVNLSDLTCDGFDFICPNCLENNVIRQKYFLPTHGWNIRYGFKDVGVERKGGKLVPKEDKFHQGHLDFVFKKDVFELEHSAEKPC